MIAYDYIQQDRKVGALIQKGLFPSDGPSPFQNLDSLFEEYRLQVISTKIAQLRKELVAKRAEARVAANQSRSRLYRIQLFQILEGILLQHEGAVQAREWTRIKNSKEFRTKSPSIVKAIDAVNADLDLHAVDADLDKEPLLKRLGHLYNQVRSSTKDK